jgi:asparagine N-glycosylation enzyme membrane subunit Stt3
MSESKESPIITIERRKAITVIVATVIMAVAVGGGLMKVGSGFAARTTQGITVMLYGHFRSRSRLPK